MVVGKFPEHLILTLIIKKLKISVEQDRVVTTLNLFKQLNNIFSVVKGPFHMASQVPTIGPQETLEMSV